MKLKGKTDIIIFTYIVCVFVVSFLGIINNFVIIAKSIFFSLSDSFLILSSIITLPFFIFGFLSIFWIYKRTKKGWHFSFFYSSFSIIISIFFSFLFVS